jgi:hypothetical protein
MKEIDRYVHLIHFIDAIGVFVKIKVEPFFERSSRVVFRLAKVLTYVYS